MPENKKIANASAMTYAGIKFKSQLEVMTYKTLVEEGFNPQYEPTTYIIWTGFVPTIPFFTKNTLKRKDRRYEVISTSTVRVYKSLTSITYTPDFYFEYGGKKIIVESKGIPNDVFPYKFKMFRKYLEEQPDKENYIIWEIHTKKQLLECINYLRHSLSQ